MIYLTLALQIKDADDVKHLFTLTEQILKIRSGL